MSRFRHAHSGCCRYLYTCFSSVLGDKIDAYMCNTGPSIIIRFGDGETEQKMVPVENIDKDFPDDDVLQAWKESKKIKICSKT